MSAAARPSPTPSLAARTAPGRDTLAGALAALLVLAPIVLLQRDGELPTSARLVSAVTWVLCFVPMLQYFRASVGRRAQLPLLPLSGISFALLYPMQLLFGGTTLTMLETTFVAADVRDVLRANEFVLLGWSAYLLGYWAVSLAPPARPREPVPLDVPRLARVAELLTVGGFVVATFAGALNLPLTAQAFLRLAQMVQLLGGGLIMTLDARGLLPAGQRVRALVLAIGTAAPLAVTGSVGNVLFAVVIYAAARWIGGARLRMSIVLAIGVAALAVVVLKGVTAEFRTAVWFTGERTSAAERAAVYYELVSERVAREGVDGTISHGMDISAKRVATTALFADVIAKTPAVVPFWGGESFKGLAGAFIPRFLWPDKPQHVVGQSFGHRYGYLHPTDLNTSINLPFLIEFYANFGENGIVFGMLIAGALLRVAQRIYERRRHDVVFACAGIVVLMYLALGHESDFALAHSGIVLNSIALWTLARMITSYVRLRPRRADG